VKSTIQTITAQQRTEITERAIAAGRHSERYLTACDGCREWVPGIYHVTLDKKRLCVRCAAGQGIQGAKDLLARGGGA